MRYEMQAERTFFKLIKDLRALNEQSQSEGRRPTPATPPTPPEPNEAKSPAIR